MKVSRHEDVVQGVDALGPAIGVAEAKSHNREAGNEWKDGNTQGDNHAADGAKMSRRNALALMDEARKFLMWQLDDCGDGDNH